MNLAFLADGDPSKGIGHLVRALSLALELSSEQEIAFFSASDSGLVRKIEAQLRPFYPEAKIQIKNSPALAGSWEESAAVAFALLEGSTYSALIIDGKYPWGPERLGTLREKGKVVLIDYFLGEGESCDALLFPTNHADLERVSEWEKRQPVYHGTPYTWLHPEVRRLSQARVPAEQRARVLVIMGGADPKNRTQEAIEWLNRLGVREIDVVVGPANKFGQEIRQAMENIGSQARCLENISEARSALARARFAICAFGISAYECYSLGTPVLLATHEKSDRRDAEAFLNRMPHAGVFWDPSANFIPEFRNFPDPSLGNQLGHLAENLGKILRSI